MVFEGQLRGHTWLELLLAHRLKTIITTLPPNCNNAAGDV